MNKFSRMCADMCVNKFVSFVKLHDEHMYTCLINVKSDGID